MCVFLTGNGNKKNGQDWKPRSLQDTSQTARTAQKTEEPNLRRELEGHVHVHADQGHELSDEDGWSHVYNSKGKMLRHPNGSA